MHQLLDAHQPVQHGGRIDEGGGVALRQVVVGCLRITEALLLVIGCGVDRYIPVLEALTLSTLGIAASLEIDIIMGAE